MYISTKQSEDLNKVRSVNRAGNILLENNKSDKGDSPFITKVQVVSETSNKVVFEVTYFMSGPVSGQYNISLHPNMSGWSQSANTMRPGLNKEIVSVSFKPNHIATTRRQSTLMNLYVNRYDGKAYSGKVFDRKIQFPKEWIR